MTPVPSPRDHWTIAQPFVRLLGPVEYITAAGRTIDLPSASQRQVLATLAIVPGATVRPDQLSDALGLTNGALRATVSRLRGRIGDGVITTGPCGYRLTGCVDTQVFTRAVTDRNGRGDRISTLRDALSLWHGDALDEFRHEMWAQAEAHRLDELRLVAIEDLAEALTREGRGGEAIALLEGLTIDHPLRDHAQGLLIQALASVGRQAEALRTYQSYRRLLATETGTDPSAEVDAIEHRVAQMGRVDPPAPQPPPLRRRRRHRGGHAPRRTPPRQSI